MDPYLGQIACFAFDFVPRGWLPCDGSLLPITQYSALFSLLGTTYGGDGRTTFAVPDLRDRTPVSPGSAVAQGATAELAKGDGPVGCLGMLYCICVEGVFPPR